MSKKSERREKRIAAAKKRDTELFAQGTTDAGAIANLDRLDGATLGKLLVSKKVDARPMSPTREVSLRVLGAAHALVTVRQAARERSREAEASG